MSRTRIAAAVVGAALLMIPAAAARAEFSDVVRVMESKAGGAGTPIPLFGLVRMVIWIAHPDGVHDIQLATWEDKHVTIDGRELEPLIRARVGAGYSPIVTTRSRDGEWTYIYARPAKRGLMDVMIVAHDKSDSVVMRALIEPNVLANQINDSRHRRHHHTDIAFR